MAAPIIYEDTRQQVGKHKAKNDWFAAHGIEVVRRKLDFGDYQTDGSNISVDTKKDLNEVCMDVGRDHDRFIREAVRAHESGYLLVVLVEVGRPYKTVADVSSWVNKVCQRCKVYRAGYCDPFEGGCTRFKRRPMQGPQLTSTMQTLATRHHFVWEFCPPHKAGQRICQLLGVKPIE